MSGEVISESAFEHLADETLRAMVEALSDAEEDFEADLSSGVLTIKFEDGKRYVVNSHRAARQIWMAAESTAWHFDWDGTHWVSTKSREELWSVLEGAVSRKVGHPLSLRRA